MILKDYLSASLMLEEQKLEEQASNAQKTADILMSCIEIGILLYRAEFKEVYIKKIRNAYKEKSFHTLVAILDEKLWTKYQLSIDSIEDLRLQAKGLFLADLIVDPQEFKKMQFKILAEKDVEIEKIYKIHLDLQSRQQCLKQHKEFKWASSEAEEIF
ncbi:MAG: hypothetical protein HAW62_04435 [Endozoicomonadaceae bacterium]|nr:hypothetical protein [Endozoicomonadaceae bacterium]